MLCIRLAYLLLFSATVLAQGPPVGTVIPITLSTGLNADKDQTGKAIEGSVMQDVPLPSGQIKAGSHIVGHIVSVNKSFKSGSSLVVRFDSIEDHKNKTAVTLAVLAMTSMAGVHDAESPVGNTADQDPTWRWITRQVGGDMVDRTHSKVVSPQGEIGRWLEGNSVLIKLTPRPDCPSGSGYNLAQAVWVFSSDACGTYGLDNLTIVNFGRNPPVGNIELSSDGNVNIRGGSGWLLIVVAAQ